MAEFCERAQELHDDDDNDDRVKVGRPAVE